MHVRCDSAQQTRYHGATERQPFEALLEQLPEAKRYASVLLQRLDKIKPLPRSAAILDVGAAQGLFLISCARLGHEATGVEPWADARENAVKLADSAGLKIDIVDGVAEHLPFPSNSFDVVRACSVIEHVADAAAAFSEAHRVLKPNGVFWFETASSLCPRQGEIRGFPAFGWYPNALKLKIMAWAVKNRPDLIGYTEMPAIHWFTPKKARRMLGEAGFSKVYDRWDLRLPSEGGPTYQLVLGAIKKSSMLKFLADAAIPCCSYAAIK